ncbi:hypothetical protein [Mesorhizobium sp. L48C026A00]|uniref:hypothetical protein n=1 Tax=Mesorhizobium sp. L48C026A00 TaxID=1287182 RepID=UPI0003CFB970|nr:hypothetical protein [Mesorhizobium sp. L48C026A00]ESZ09419.1 hypothetical protein X737_32890 [Mesorhizobium sp. L48C026A00]
MPSISAAAKSGLRASEFIVEGEGVSALAYFREGAASLPLIVGLPGAGHLARVYYGHDGARSTDFLDHWLEERGFGLLALSYPSDHPVFPRPDVALTTTMWAAAAATITADIIAKRSLPPDVLLMGWSMAGRASRAFTRAAESHGLAVRGFISLAATPPLPRLADRPPQGQPFTEDGLWKTDGRLGDAQPQHELYLNDIHWRNGGREYDLIAAADYFGAYTTNTPILLRGEPEQGSGLSGNSLVETITDLGSFDFSGYPITGAIIPTSPLDARHVVTDQATWAFLNSQKLYSIYEALARAGASIGSDNVWNSILDVKFAMETTLSCSVEGGHFFFIGREGAMQTAAHISRLSAALDAIRSRLQALGGASSSPPPC